MLGEYLGAGSSVTKLLLHLNGNANDVSGNGNNGPPVNVTWFGGKIGSGSASSNGASSYITTTNIQNASQGTFSLYFYLYSNKANNFLFADDGAGYCTACVNESGDSGNLSFNCFDTSSKPASFAYSTIGVWTNFVGTYKAGEKVKLYLNGKLVGESASVFNGLGNTATPIRFFKSGANYFDGKIDELIYENRAWTAEEIRKYYTHSQGKYIL